MRAGCLIPVGRLLHWTKALVDDNSWLTNFLTNFGTLMRRLEWHFPRMRPSVAQRPHTQRLRFEMRRKRSCLQRDLTLPLLLPMENGQVGSGMGLYFAARAQTAAAAVAASDSENTIAPASLALPPSHSHVHVACRLPWRRLITVIRLADFAPPSFRPLIAASGRRHLPFALMVGSVRPRPTASDGRERETEAHCPQRSRA